MEQAQTMDLTTVQMERINCVRMYLGVQYINEICNTSGYGSVVGIMTGQTRNLEYKTTTTKPYQIKPNTRSWTLWRQVLETLSTNNRLKTKLGECKKDHSRYGH